MESVRRHREKERREHLWQRLRFHERMLANHTAAFQEILDRHQAGLDVDKTLPELDRLAAKE
jgi:hypothetical protein